MNIVKFLIFTLFCLNFEANAQICNYCPIEELKETLKENDIDYTVQYNIKSNTVFTHKEKDFIKKWYVEFNMCYLYEITVLNPKKVKPLKKLIDKHFSKLDKYNWESLDNIVRTDFKDGFHKFYFYPKASYNNLNSKNNN